MAEMGHTDMGCSVDGERREGRGHISRKKNPGKHRGDVRGTGEEHESRKKAEGGHGAC